MNHAPIPDVPFEIGGKVWTLRIDHMAIAHFERHADMSFMRVMLHVDDFVNGRDLPRISLIGYLLWSALSSHHPEMDLQTAMRMGVDANILSALATAFESSMPKGDPADPLAKAAASAKSKSRPKRSGTGTPKSVPGAKRASATPNSGRQHRAN